MDSTEKQVSSQEVVVLPMFDSQSEHPVMSHKPFKQTKRFHSNSYSHPGIENFKCDFDFSELDLKSPAILPLDLKSSASTLSSALGNKVPSKNGKRPKSKKAGGGGKGIWNSAKILLDEDLELDSKDPDYDSDFNDPIQLKRVDPIMKEEVFDDTVNNWIKEFFDHADYKELVDTLSEVSMSSKQRCRLPYLAIGLAIQGKCSQCELTSELLSALSGTLLSSNDLQNGFDFILTELPDLTLDSPHAPESVGRFIARAIADDVLPPKFIQNVHLKARTHGELPKEAMEALSKAETLLSQRHAFARLDAVWGLRGGIKATKLLIRKIRLLLTEYLSADDLTEARRCLVELDVPHFHHELVYQAVLLAIEKSTEEAAIRLTRLLDSLCQSVVITVDQLERGVQRIYADLSDIQLDVPAAYLLLERFMQHGLQANFITHKLVNQLPSKGRKRFVSDGDGGALFKKNALQP